MFDGPWVKLNERPATFPPRVPGTRLAMKMGLRPFSSSASICSRVTSFWTEADSVCSRTVEAETSTVCVEAPTVSVASMTRAALGSSLLSLVSYLWKPGASAIMVRSEEHTSELQSPCNLVCRLLLEKKNHQ